MKIIRKSINLQFPEIKVYISCEDDFMYLLEGENDVLSFSEKNNRKNEFAYIREIKASTTPPHPLLAFMEESDIKIIHNIPKKPNQFNRCLLSPETGLPDSRPVKIEPIEQYIRMRGYEPIIVSNNMPNEEKIAAIRSADWVVGAENEYLFEAIYHGIKTSLIPTGIGCDLYKKLDPKGEILNV